MLRKVLTMVFLPIAAILIAIGIGTYVYPSNPWIVWGLLFLCWVCYRLHLRAQAMFGPRQSGGERTTPSRANSKIPPAP